MRKTNNFTAPDWPSITSKIPKIKDSNSLLAIELADLSEHDEAQLLQRLEGSLPPSDSAKIQLWTPPKSLLQLIAKQSSHRDRRANIHALAILVCRYYGPSRFVVADALTRRQLSGNCRVGERPGVSVVMVAARPAGSSEDGVCVVARRASEDEMDNARLLGMLEELAAQKTTSPREYAILGAGYYISEFTLYDPDRKVFSADTQPSLASLRRELYTNAVTAALSGCHRLPAELVADIIARADTDTDTDIDVDGTHQELAVVFPYPPRKEKHLVIFLLSPATTSEYDQTWSALQHATREYIRENGKFAEHMPVELIPWERHHTVSRRDLIALWRRYCLHVHGHPGPKALNFLLEPIHAVDAAQFGTVCPCSDGASDALASRTTLNIMIEETRGGRRPDVPEMLQRRLEPGSADTESMYDPDEPFYLNSAPWQPAGDFPEGRQCVTVFYLTNQLTVEQDRAVRNELKTRCDGEEGIDYVKECCYVPWAGSADATMVDIWDILWNVHTYSASRFSYSPCFFCVDRLSGIDLSLLVVALDWYNGFEEAVDERFLTDIPVPRLRGFQYVRLPGREAHAMKWNIDLPFRGMEVFDDVRAFRRPGWPVPGMIPGDGGLGRV